MSTLIEILPKDRCTSWLSIDMSDDDDVGYPVVIPMFGPDHYAGLDCWCCPEIEDGVIVHEACH